MKIYIRKGANSSNAYQRNTRLFGQTVGKHIDVSITSRRSPITRKEQQVVGFFARSSVESSTTKGNDSIQSRVVSLHLLNTCVPTVCYFLINLRPGRCRDNFWLFFSKMHEKELKYMSQLRAGGPVIPGLLRPARVKYGRNTRRVVTATRFTTVMNTISIYGRAHTSLTERWQVLFSRYS